VATTRDELRRLIDQLPDSQLEEVARLLEERARQHTFDERLDSLPEDDEPVTEEELRVIEEGEADYAAGRTVPMSRILAKRAKPAKT
jgi:hypothetical protein